MWKPIVPERVAAAEVPVVAVANDARLCASMARELMTIAEGIKGGKANSQDFEGEQPCAGHRRRLGEWLQDDTWRDLACAREAERAHHWRELKTAADELYTMAGLRGGAPEVAWRTWIMDVTALRERIEGELEQAEMNEAKEARSLEGMGSGWSEVGGG